MFCPKKKGFFPLLLMRAQESLSASDRAAFSSATATHEERLVRLFSAAGCGACANLLDAVVAPAPHRGEKSGVRSQQNRTAGNEAFAAGSLRQAQILYSCAVFVAPSPWVEEDGSVDDSFALALANRSACLQRLNSPKLALADINLALHSGYPEAKMFKLFERKGECLELLKRYSEASEAYEKAIAMISRSPLSKEKCEKTTAAFKKKIRHLKSKEKNVAADADVKDSAATKRASTSSTSPGALEVSSASATHPSLHRAVRIVRGAGDVGRHAVATEDIPAGVVLARERPIVHSQYADRAGANCHHCLGVLVAAVPCSRCAWVVFCSAECRDEADLEYHDVECGILKLLLESGLNVYAFLTLRAVVKQGIKSLLALREPLSRRDELGRGVSDEMSAGDMYRSHDFCNLYSLVSQEEHLTGEDWFLRTLIAGFLLKLLTKTSFFDESTGEKVKGQQELTKDQAYVGGILLQVLNVCPCNCHDISEIETPVTGKFVPACSKVSLGAAVYPTLALFNHSCDPDFMRCNSGTSVVCVANRNITKGEEICENYGLMYTMKPTSDRKKILLEHYKFPCMCDACTIEYPTVQQMKAERVDGIEEEKVALHNAKCSQCGLRVFMEKCPLSLSAPCSHCGTPAAAAAAAAALPEVREASQRAVTRLTSGDWRGGVESAAECVALAKKHFEWPLLEATQAQVALWKGMWLVAGNMKTVKAV